MLGHHSLQWHTTWTPYFAVAHSLDTVISSGMQLGHKKISVACSLDTVICSGMQLGHSDLQGLSDFQWYAS